jgi:spermidine synthase
VTLLGAVSPFAIRLALDDVAEAGSVAGRLYALSTVGSIVGTFLSALVTIPLVGTQRTMLGAAVLMALAATLLIGVRFLPVAAALAALIAVPPGAIKSAHGLLWETESTYQYVQVVRRDDGSRALFLNEGVAIHSLWYPHSVLTGGEWDMFLVIPPLPDRPVRRVLLIGNAGGTTARAYGALYPRIAIDGVEIDPKVTEAGRRFLGLGDNPRLHVVTADARPYLAGTHRRWDAILIDAYRQPYIPFYLATKEFFQLARDHLRPGGVVALNIAALPGDDRLANSVAGTVASVFPQAWEWRPLRFNELVLGFDRPVSKADLVSRVAGVNAHVSSLVPLFRSELRAVNPAPSPLTDDRAPVELVTDRMLVRYIAEGGSLDEQPLPTAP